MKRYEPELIDASFADGTPHWLPVMDENGGWRYVLYSDATATLAARDAEIERLKAELSMREQRCEERCMGYPAEDVRHWVAQEAFDRERALREKRERQLVRITHRYSTSGTHYWVKPTADGSVGRYDGTDAGLLAAIDEACH